VFKFNKAQKKLCEELRVAYSEARADLEARAEELHSFLNEVHDSMSAGFEEKSEKWQEGESGEAAREWIESLEEKCDELGNIEIPEIDEIPEGAAV